MKNEILLEERIEFGKLRGLTGAEALKHNFKYLTWIYKNTDINLDSRIVNILLSRNVEPMKVRHNSKVNNAIKGSDANPFDTSMTSNVAREFADRLRKEMEKARAGGEI